MADAIHATPMGGQHRTTRMVLTIVVWLLFGIFVLGPLLTVVAISFAKSVIDRDWTPSLAWYGEIIGDPGLYMPIFRSLEIAIIVVVVQLVLGSLVASVTVRNRIHGARLLDAVSNVTIALPSVVLGLALLAFYGGFGPVQSLTDLVFGKPWSLTWTLWIVVLAHVLETFPYMVRTVATGMHRLDPEMEMAARSLGAKPFRVWRTITLPQLGPSLASGAVLVFSRSIAEFGATIIVVSAVLNTAPINIYVEAEGGSLELAAAYSVVLMILSLLAYVALRRMLRGNVQSI